MLDRKWWEKSFPSTDGSARECGKLLVRQVLEACGFNLLEPKLAVQKKKKNIMFDKVESGRWLANGCINVWDYIKFVSWEIRLLTEYFCIRAS